MRDIFDPGWVPADITSSDVLVLFVIGTGILTVRQICVVLHPQQ